MNFSSGDNWKGFFGYILEVEFFKTGSLEEKIISRLIVSFPQGLESTEVFGNTTACIETPGEIEFGGYCLLQCYEETNH